MSESRDFFPKVFKARQSFPRPVVTDIPAAIDGELAKIFPSGSLKEGASIGVTVGSRGITNIAEITRAAIDGLKRLGASPFVIPAMGSHGGARGEAQRELIAHYGVTEESMGVPIRHDMTTRNLGTTPEGVEAYLAETALDCDGVLLMNRVKPHTDFKGPIESGLTKICAIGLGKYDGAQEYHSHIFDLGLGPAIYSATRAVLETGQILGGLAILENGYHETARIVGVRHEKLMEEEEVLLKEAYTLMPSLPLKEIDILICDRMGKNISGAGMDTNITGRGVHGYYQGVPWQEGMPGIYRIFVRDLSDESDGNAVGMGMVDFTTKRFAEKIDHKVTAINAVTACTPGNSRLPIVLDNDEEAITTALKSSPRRKGGTILAYIRDTLELESLYLSEACLPLIRDRAGIDIETEPQPIRFDTDGNIVSFFTNGNG